MRVPPPTLHCGKEARGSVSDKARHTTARRAAVGSQPSALSLINLLRTILVFRSRRSPDHPIRRFVILDQSMRNTSRSKELHSRAERLVPGGVNSPVRAFRSVACDPPYIVRGKGSRIWDADGNEYIDYVC